MANILIQRLETMLSSRAEGVFRARSFFEKVSGLFLIMVCVQLCAQWYSFSSEVEYIAKYVIMESSPTYRTYIPAFLFEVLKGVLVGMAIRSFLAGDTYTATLIPAVCGVLLSYGSWWMSDQGTVIIASNEAGPSPIESGSSEIKSTYEKDIKVINDEIEEIEAREFHWCGEHRKAHKCDSELNNFYIDPIKDKKHVKRIKWLKSQRDGYMSTKDSLIKEAKAQFAVDTKQYQDTKEQLESRLSTKVLFAELATWLALSFIMYVYFMLTPERKTDKEEKPSSPKQSPTPPPNKGGSNPQPNNSTEDDTEEDGSDTGGVSEDTESGTAPVSNGTGAVSEGVSGATATVSPPVRQQFSVEEMVKANLAFIQLQQQNPDVLEEIIAQHERLKSGRTEGEGK